MNLTPTDNRDAVQATFARAGLFSLGGAVVGAVGGFALNLLLANVLGDSDYGAVLQAIAIFSIALSFGKLGMDSAAMWVCARSHALSRERLEAAARMMLAATVIGCGVGAIAVVGAGLALRASADPGTRQVGNALVSSGWALPFAGLVLVVLSASRGLGAIKPYVLLGSVGLSVVRIVGAGIVAIVGWKVAGQAFVWAGANVLIVLVAIPVLRRQLRRAQVSDEPVSSEAGSRREITRFALGRTISAGLEQGLLYLDIVLVGLIAGSAAAGVYGGATRFVAAGLIAEVGIRAVVAPRFGTLIHRGEFGELQALYRLSAVWLVLLSAPVYFILAVFAPVVLGWLGPDFVAGDTVLVILSFGTMLTLAAGNIHSVLLMGGFSGLAALNKAAALGVNIVANLVLVPWIGINGAAVAWTIAMLLDAAMATFEVRRRLDVNPQVGAILYPLLIAGVTFGVPAILVRSVWGATTLSMFLTIVLSTVPFATWCVLDRERLGLANLSAVLRRRPAA